MEAQEIIDAIKGDEKLMTAILPTVTDSELGKKLIQNRVDLGIKDGIDAKISEVHTRYDDDIFAILGVRPEVKDGKKQKTYDLLKDKLTEFKKLLDNKDLVDKDEAVKVLKAQIEELTTKGGGSHVQAVFDKAKDDWAKEKADLEGKIIEKETALTTGAYKNEIANALTGIKFNPDVNETLKKIALKNAEDELLKTAKTENGKTVFYGADGKPITNPTTYEPATAAEVLAGMESIKAISLTTPPGGGGADPVLKGSISTAKVEGRDVQTLTLPAGSFKTRSEFADVSERALLESGVTKSETERWVGLQNEAYKRYEVAKLPD